MLKKFRFSDAETDVQIPRKRANLLRIYQANISGFRSVFVCIACLGYNEHSCMVALYCVYTDKHAISIMESFGIGSTFFM